MGEHRIETNIEIDAPPDRVWAVLTDFDGMSSWNPFIKSISGRMATGERLSVQMVPPGKAGMTFRPSVLKVQESRELRWVGHLLFAGLFDGEHYFLLTPIGDKKTRLTQGEKFSGVLVGLFRSTLTATEAGFVAMNAALKQKAEERNAPRN